jgi:hypothetical protein
MHTTLGGRVLRRMRYRREGARSVRSSVIIVVLLLVFVVAVAACGGSEDDAYVGYWRMPPVEKSFLDYDLLQVRRAGDAYEVRFDTLPWHRAELVDGRLQVQSQRRVGSSSSLGVDLEVTNGQGTIYVSASPSPNTSAVVRLSEEEYRSEFEAMADDDLRLTVFGLAEFVRMWAEAHGGSPPAPSEMTPDSDFGSHLAELVEGLGPEEVIPWPWNPFTGEPIAIGSESGDLVYTTDGQDFTLGAHDSCGAVVSP